MLAKLDVVSRHWNKHEPAILYDVPNKVPGRSDMLLRTGCNCIFKVANVWDVVVTI